MYDNPDDYDWPEPEDEPIRQQIRGEMSMSERYIFYSIVGVIAVPFIGFALALVAAVAYTIYIGGQMLLADPSLAFAPAGLVLAVTIGVPVLGWIVVVLAERGYIDL